MEREKTGAEDPEKNDGWQCDACAGRPTPLPFEMATAASVAMKTGLPQFINATSDDATRLLCTAATRMSNTMITAAMTTAATMTAATTTASVARHDATRTFPTMTPELFQAPQQYPFQLPAHRLPFLPPYYFPPLIVRPPEGVARKRKPQDESHCCKKYWTYCVLGKPE